MTIPENEKGIYVYSMMGSGGTDASFTLQINKDDPEISDLCISIISKGLDFENNSDFTFFNGNAIKQNINQLSSNSITFNLKGNSDTFMAFIMIGEISTLMTDPFNCKDIILVRLMMS